MKSLSRPRVLSEFLSAAKIFQLIFYTASGVIKRPRNSWPSTAKNKSPEIDRSFQNPIVLLRSGRNLNPCHKIQRCHTDPLSFLI